MSAVRVSFILATVVAATTTGCDRNSSRALGDGDQAGSGGGGPSGQSGAGGSAIASGGSAANGGTDSGPLNNPSGPRYHPPEGFEDCEHAPVEEDCSDGWCVLPPSCFVMGSPEDEWSRGASSEDQVAVTLTHSIEIQQMEMARREWREITDVDVSPPDDIQEPCLEDTCPISNVTWWEATLAANLLSTQRGIEPCYQPVECQNNLGQGRYCQSVADPAQLVYECEGYRLPTRAEAEYATRAGTITTFYSGDISIYPTYTCELDSNLDKIGWYCHNSGDRLHERGQKLPNDFGLFDMIGNVREWTNDGNRIGSSSGGVNPDGAVAEHAERLTFVGQYDSQHSTHRTASVQGVAAKGRGYRIGFRLVRTLFEESERSLAIAPR